MMFFWTVPLYALPFRCLANSTACAFAPPPFRGSAIAPFLRNAARPSMAAYDQKKSIQQSPVTLNLIQGLYRPSVRSLCFVNKVQKIPPLGSLLYRTTKPRHPELDSGAVPPSMRSLSVAKKAIVPRACRRNLFSKKRHLQKIREYFKARLSGCPKMTWCNL